MISQEVIALADEKLEDIQVWLQISPWKSLGRLSQEVGLSAGACALKAAKLIKFCPYRVVHELKLVDALQRI
jgi:hypothetical protein